MKGSTRVAIPIGYAGAVTSLQIVRDLGFHGWWTYVVMVVGFYASMLLFAYWVDVHDRNLTKTLQDEQQERDGKWLNN